MSYLRNRAGLVIFIIGLAIVAFLLGDLINYGTPFWMKNQNQVGSVNGESIDYQTFNAQVDQTTANFQQQMGGGAATPEIRNYAVQQVWNQFLSQELLKQEIEKIGLTLGADELNSLVTGPNPSPQILQTFTNPQNGQFDRATLNNVIAQSKSNPEVRQQWEALLENVRNDRLNQKYSSLLNNSVFVTKLEAQEEYNQRNKLANFKYVMLDYSSVKDSEIKLTDADYKEYYDKHKNGFNNQEETRSLEYVLFDASPTKADTTAALTAINTLKTELQTSTNDSLFVSVNSDTKFPVKYYSKGQLNPALDSVVFNVASGTTVGPYLSNGSYEIAKVLESKFSPDSVKASHILLNATAEGGIDKAKLKADSIKGLLEKGESFAPLAIQFSVDEASKVNGGDLGTFARGRMVPEFENAIFSGKAGEVKVVETQFGVHVIKIERLIGNSKIAKVAVIDKAIISGKTTTDDAYAKANSFFSSVDSKNFVDQANKQGLKVEKSARTLPMDNSLNSTAIPRELLRWAFEAEKGDISDKVYETDNHFIVARVVDIQEKGLQPLASVKSEIEPAVRNQVKARMLKEKMDNALAGATSIDQAAQKLGKAAIQVDNVVLANPVIPGIALEGSVIGTVFGLQPNKPSKSIEGYQGVYAVQVASFVNPKELAGDDLKAQQKQALSVQSQRAWSGIYKALTDKADIDDNRIRFY
ncbi:peptidylprolyl isomerase [Sphingobacterium hungaricum]|nr:SurA N-terminal domain-containing protein [Sphingobacterium hungaricum]